MQKIKKFITLIVLCICTCIFAGCAYINSSLIVFADGKIQDKLIIELDDMKLFQAGVSSSTMSSAKRKIRENLNTNFIMRGRKFISLVLSSNDLTTQQKEFITNGFECEMSESGSQFIAYAIYDSPAIFNLFQKMMLGIENEDFTHSQDVIKIEKNLFSIKYITSEAVNCYSVLRNSSYTKLINEFEDLFDNRFTLGDVELTQIFASPDTNLRSNANNTAIEQNVKFHEWNINPENLDFKLEFYKLRANEISWYILALVLTLIIGCVIYYLYKKNKDKPTTINENELDNNKEDTPNKPL